MVNRYTKLRVRRKLKRQQKVIEKAGTDANLHFDKHVVRRWRNLKEVRRFVIGWLVLVLLLTTGVLLQGRDLSAFYTQEKNVAGGVYREAMLGEITNMNPIFATSPVDQAAAKLMFNNLLKYDDETELEPDLAQSWEVSKDGKTYTFKLRQDVYWHDGSPVTAEDVVYTFEAIQHPDTRSYLGSSWQNIKVQAKDDYTVTFVLPNAFPPFPHSLTRGGILPKHILGGIEPSQLRGHPFNVNEPIGTGPFIFNDIVEDKGIQNLSLDGYDRYHLGKPKISDFVLLAYEDYDNMLNDFENGEATAIAGLRLPDRAEIENEVDNITHDLPLTNGIYTFFNTTEGKFKNAKVRQALTRATNQDQIIADLGDRFVPVDGPLLRSHLGFNEKLTQLKFDKKLANKLFDEVNWRKGPDGMRRDKQGEIVKFNLVTQNSEEFPRIAEIIQQQWEEVGITLEVTFVEEDQMQQNHIIPHNYEILLFGITIGPDPDVFAYWHSSQSEVGGFNLSEYSNEVADVALESGRTRANNQLRVVKYEPFQKEWRQDAPAVGLYQPNYIYVQQDRLGGYQAGKITSPEDRFNDVHLWKINTRTSGKDL